MRELSGANSRLRGDLSHLQPEELQGIPEMVSLFAHLEVPQRFAELYFGSVDPLLDLHPQGTLRTLSVLAEGALHDADTLWRACREAGRNGVLLNSLAGIALDVDLDLALRVARLAVAAAPFSVPALEGLAWIHDRRGEAQPRDALLLRADAVVAAGLAEELAEGLLQRALYRAAAGDPRGARDLLERAVSMSDAVTSTVRSDAAFAVLVPLLPAR